MWHRAMASSLIYQVIVLSCVIASVSSLYFHIQETEKKCFIEEIPEQTMVTGKHQLTSVITSHHHHHHQNSNLLLIHSLNYYYYFYYYSFIETTVFSKSIYPNPLPSLLINSLIIFQYYYSLFFYNRSIIIITKPPASIINN